MKKKKLSEKQVITALKDLERGWPDGLWLFSWNGTLCLMKGNKNTGEREELEEQVVESFSIPNDGGDP